MSADTTPRPCGRCGERHRGYEICTDLTGDAGACDHHPEMADDQDRCHHISHLAAIKALHRTFVHPDEGIDMCWGCRVETPCETLRLVAEVERLRAIDG